MKHPPIEYLGIDVAKSWLDFDLPDPRQARVANEAAAIAAVLPLLPAGVHLVCESTGGYEAALVAGAQAAGRPISVVPPQRVRHHARSAGRLAKTDRADARLLSEYGRTHRPAAQRSPEPVRQRLKELVRTRAQLIELQKVEAGWREHPAALPLLQTLAQQRAELVREQLESIEREIRREVRAMARRAELERMQEVPGVGEVTAWTVWAEMPELGTMERGQPAALVGLAPYAQDSGQHRGKRYIQQGRAQVRRVLFMAAVTAARHNPILRAFYQGLRARGKPAKLALIAVARRLIELLNIMLKYPNFVLAQ